MEQHAARLQDSPPTAERLRALRELDSAVKETENAVQMAIHTQIAVALAIIATFPKEQQTPLDDVSREMEKMRPALEAEVKSEVLVSLLYTYRSLTEAEIKSYTEFARSPAGSNFDVVAMAAFEKATLGGAVKWGELIGNAIKEAQSNSEA